MSLANIPNFSIERELGRGGMAVVYLARHVLLNRQVALKVMDPSLDSQPGFLERFLDEGRIMASLEHPHIVRVYDVGISEDKSTAYLNMELLSGGSLKDLLETSGALSFKQALQVLEQIGSGLELAHRKGFIHRDIKPGNILFRDDGQAVLTDFGIAKLQDSVGELTRMGYTLGSVRYMSPEQASTTQLDNRSDIYSLGLVFYEMLTGKPAVVAQSTVQAIHSHVALPAPSLPPQYNALQPVLNRVLAKDPAERYPNVAAFIEAVRHAPLGSEEATVVIGRQAAPTTQLVQQQAVTNNRQPLFIAALLGVLVVALVAGGLWLFTGQDTAGHSSAGGSAQGTTASQLFATQDNTATPPSSSNGSSASTSTTTPLGKEKVNLVLDGSGSMWQQVGGVSKIAIARDVLGSMIDDWDSEKELGLLAYGHNKKGDCTDIEQLIPIGAVDKSTFKRQIKQISPKGKTPISAALRQAAQALKYQEDPATVILISDGKESCGADPCAVAKELEQAGVQFTAHVIGFAIDDVKTSEQLQCIAAATGGRYEAARDRDEFQQALAAQAAKPTPPRQSIPADQQPDKPETPAVVYNTLKVVSLSAATGKPLPADIYVYQLDEQAARQTMPLNAWALLGIHSAHAAKPKLVDSRLGVTSAEFKLALGHYQVVVRNAEDTQQVNVKLQAGKPVVQTFKLKETLASPEPEPKTGTLQLSIINAQTGKPWKVALQIKNLATQQLVVEKTDISRASFTLDAGRYQLSATTRSGEQHSDKVDVLAGKTLAKKLAIKPKVVDPPPLASLKLSAVIGRSSQPVAAKFTILQGRKQVAQGTGIAFSTRLNAGEYQVVATPQQGRSTGRAKVVLKAGKTHKVVVHIPLSISPPLEQVPDKPLQVEPLKPSVIDPTRVVPIRPNLEGVKPAKPYEAEPAQATPPQPQETKPAKPQVIEPVQRIPTKPQALEPSKPQQELVKPLKPALSPVRVLPQEAAQPSKTEGGESQ